MGGPRRKRRKRGAGGRKAARVPQLAGTATGCLRLNRLRPRATLILAAARADYRVTESLSTVLPMPMVSPERSRATTMRRPL